MEHPMSRLSLVGGAVSLGLSNLLLWAQGLDLDDAAGQLTLAATALVGIVGILYGGIVELRIRYRRRWDEANKDSLSAQIEQMREQMERMVAENAEGIDRARNSLHQFRNEAQAREIRHAEEIDRLLDQNRLLHETIDRLNAEIDHLSAEVARLRTATTTLADVTSHPPDPSAEAPHG